MVKEISAIELKDKMDMGHRFVLLDVRGDEFFDEEHIPGAISAPVGHIGEGIECCVMKDADVIVYCTNEKCALSEDGARLLESLGFTSVFRYVGGLQGWRDAGFKTIVTHINEKVA